MAETAAAGTTAPAPTTTTGATSAPAATTASGEGGDIATSFPVPREPTEIRGTPGPDLLVGTSGNDNILGLRGDDVLFGAAGDDSLQGGQGDDVMDGGPGFDAFDGGPGRDTVSYANDPSGVRVELGLFGSGHDGFGNFESYQRVENVVGSAFGDTLLGDDENNVLQGGPGEDVLDGGPGDDVLDGGEGGAIASWSRSEGGVVADLVAGQAVEWDGATDRLINIDGLTGSGFSDRLTGNDGANRLDGGAGADRLVAMGGNDVLIGGAGADLLDGGAGRDLADYSGFNAVRVSLAAGEAIDGFGTIDRLVAIEDVRGSLMADVIFGDDGANRIAAGGGVDTVAGLGGADTFAFEARVDLGDRIRDFQPGVDRIEIDRGALPGGNGLAAGAIDPASFVTGTAAVDANDRFVLDAAGGRLLYDADGSGPGGPITIATFVAGTPGAGDLFLV